MADRAAVSGAQGCHRFQPGGTPPHCRLNCAWHRSGSQGLRAAGKGGGLRRAAHWRTVEVGFTQTAPRRLARGFR